MVDTYSDSDTERNFPTTSPNDLPDEPYREEFQRDYARILHSASFRRLQGKTQLFPTVESDFFRSRLTHSLEVSQIAVAITRKFNHENDHFRADKISTELVSLAALAHDIGHAPFGHNGEAVLDNRMKDQGGFEGNAQTLRILSRLEKKCCAEGAEPIGVIDGRDERHGLGLTYRSYAAILKYDRAIPFKRDPDSPGLKKGYYNDDREIVDQIRKKVGVNPSTGQIQTIECSIMDLADDIAYSTYDLEDALKGNFLSPLDLISPSNEVLESTSEEINRRVGEGTIDPLTVAKVLYDIFAAYLLDRESLDLPKTINTDDPRELAAHVARIYAGTRNLADVGFYRTQFTSYLVGHFVRDVELNFNSEAPRFSTVQLKYETAIQVEVLKQFTYCALILSPQFRVVARRCQEIVGRIFDSLVDTDPKGWHLLPPDVKDLYKAFDDGRDRHRVICDYIAGMTDRYALEFYGRLFSENPETIFKPL